MLTLQVLQQRLDALMLRDKQRFARRLHGVKKSKNPDAQQAIFSTMAKEIEQAAAAHAPASAQARPSTHFIRKICLLGPEETGHSGADPRSSGADRSSKTGSG